MVECSECGKRAKWIRHTQFAGDHPYCSDHAKQQKDFGQEDSYAYWEELKRYWTIVFPGEHGQHVQETWEEKQILDSYYAYWCGMMIQNVAAPDLASENCIADWTVVHWAVETDEFGGKINV